AQDAELAEDEKPEQPPEQPLRPAEEDQRGEAEELVGDGVEDRAQGSELLEQPGGDPVEPVGDHGADEHRQRGAEPAVDEQHDEHRDGDDAQAGEEVGDVHFVAASRCWFQRAKASSLSTSAGNSSGSPGVPSAAMKICICLPTSFSHCSRVTSCGPATSRRSPPGDPACAAPFPTATEPSYTRTSTVLSSFASTRKVVPRTPATAFSVSTSSFWSPWSTEVTFAQSLPKNNLAVSLRRAALPANCASAGWRVA